MSDLHQGEFARAELWGFLAFGFSYPEEKQFALIADGTFRTDVANALRAAMAMSDDTVQELTGNLANVGDSFAQFEADYLRSFHTNTPMDSASLYESHYVRDKDKPLIMLELKAFFENFGLAVKKQDGNLEDSLTGVLEMMHFLAKREVQSLVDSANADPYRRAQADLLNKHMAQWMSAFRADVDKKLSPGFFRDLVTIADCFTSYEGGQTLERI
jgi:DMSO reductase family type II enzyme chaperone